MVYIPPAITAIFKHRVTLNTERITVVSVVVYESTYVAFYSKSHINNTIVYFRASMGS